MGTIILVIDVILAVILVALVLVQRSDGALGSLGGGASSMMTTRARGNFLTKTTWIVAFSFMICSLLLVLINKPATDTKTVILEDGAIAQVPVAAATDGNIAIPVSGEAGASTAKEPVKLTPQPVSAPISAE